MSAYLFVHFQEKKTPDGEQARFAVRETTMRIAAAH